uniref:MARVEL domain-containing protein n=1 Tax=Eptatretus burgeri TaxID=7764 RepID=A0A8C4QGA5_EPTBU
MRDVPAPASLYENARARAVRYLPKGPRTRRPMKPAWFSKQLQAALSLFSIIVFGCIINEGYINAQSASLKCVFNHNANACHYGVVVGVFAFLACIAFLALDVAFPQMSSIKDRKHAVIADLICSSVHTFLWFVGFCFLTNKWQTFVSLSHIILSSIPPTVTFDTCASYIPNDAVWLPQGGIAFLAFQRYRLGASAAFASSFPQAPAVGQNDARDMGGNKAIPTPPYITGSGVESSEAYHKPPFSEIIPGSESFAPATY